MIDKKKVISISLITLLILVTLLTSGCTESQKESENDIIFCGILKKVIEEKHRGYNFLNITLDNNSILVYNNDFEDILFGRIGEYICFYCEEHDPQFLPKYYNIVGYGI